jgi:hypothetical protein
MEMQHHRGIALFYVVEGVSCLDRPSYWKNIWEIQVMIQVLRFVEVLEDLIYWLKASHQIQPVEIIFNGSKAFVQSIRTICIRF